MKTEQPRLTLIADVTNDLGETPLWSPEEQALYWIDCENPPRVFCWRGGDDIRSWAMPERIGGLALRQDGSPVVTLHSGLFDLDRNTGALTKRVDAPLGAHCSLHECRVDRTGRLWVGAIDHRLGRDNLSPGGGAFFRLEGDRLVMAFDGVSCSNGLAFSTDGRTLYHCDSPTGLIERWSLDPANGSLSERAPFAHFPASEKGGFDGGTVDAEGGYWATAVFGSALLRFLPDGTPDRRIALPFSAPTCVAFGGPQLDTLFITSTRQEMMGPIPTEVANGAIYAFKPGVKGLAEPRLRA